MNTPRIPEIFESPPWARGLSPRSAPKLALPIPSYAEAICWADGEQERLLSEITRAANDSWIRESCNRMGIPLSVLTKPLAQPALRKTVEKGIEGSYQGIALGVLPLFPKPLAALVAELIPLRRLYVDSDGVRSLLARDGLDALDFLLRIGRTHVAPVLAGASHVRSPRLAALAARGLSNRLARGPAQRWLFEHTDAAIRGLLPVALGSAGEQQREAESTLRWLSTQGQKRAIVTIADGLGEEAAGATRGLLEHDGSLSFEQPMPALPPYATKLPVIVLANGAKVEAAALKHVVQVLAISTLEAPYMGVPIMKQSADPRSLAAFSWALFEAWREAGCASKEAWAYHQLVHFGGDDEARKLANYIRAWPGAMRKVNPPTVSFCTSNGIDILAGMDSDIALLELARIAESSKPKLEERAKERLALVASRRGLTEDEISDRVVPTLGFDPSGCCELEGGFALALDEHLNVVLRDASGVHHEAAPKGTNKTIVAALKASKKDTHAVVDRERRRLERAMCNGRRWSPAELKGTLLAHPLISRLCKRVVFGAYGPQGLASVFYLGDHGSLRDESGRPPSLDGMQIGVVHPLELGPHRCTLLGRELAPFDPLFPQLDRETHSLTEEERGATELGRWRDVSCLLGALFGLEDRGWRRVRNDSTINAFEKDVGLAGGPPRTCSLRLVPGFPVALPSLDGPRQQLGTVQLTDASRRALPYSSISLISASEIVRDLESLRR